MRLNDLEQDTIKRCVIAILEGPFIDDWEFSTRIGIERQELKRFLVKLSNFNQESDRDIQVAINNCLNEIINGISISSDEWSKWFVTPREQVADIYSKWARINSKQ